MWNQQNVNHDHTRGKLSGHFCDLHYDNDARIAWDPSWATSLHPSASLHCQTRYSVLSFWQLIKTQGLRYISPLIRLPAGKWPQLLSLYEACCFPCFSARSDSPSQATGIPLILLPADYESWVFSWQNEDMRISFLTWVTMGSGNANHYC